MHNNNGTQTNAMLWTKEFPEEKFKKKKKEIEWKEYWENLWIETILR